MRVLIVGLGLILVLAGCYEQTSQQTKAAPVKTKVAKECDGDCCCALPGRAALLEHTDKTEGAVALKTVKFEAFMKDVQAHKGKVVLAYQWSTTSAPSKKNLPTLLELQRKHKDVVLVTVSSDLEKAAKDVLKTLQEGNCTVANYQQDEKDVVDGWTSCFGCCGFPTLIVFGRDGKKAASFEVTEAPFEAATIEKTLVSLLEAK